MPENVAHPGIPNGHIITLGNYLPWWYHKQRGGDGGNYPTFSGRLLDLKESRERGIAYFLTILQDNIRTNSQLAVAVVPSHDALKLRSGVHQLATRFSAGFGALDTGDLLLRTTTIQKLATGGDRSISVHLNSMSANKIERVKGHNVLLIDDIMTTGNSLAAGRQVLLKAGAGDVLCIALGKTSYE